VLIVPWAHVKCLHEFFQTFMHVCPVLSINNWTFINHLARYSKSIFCQKSIYSFTHLTFCQAIALHIVHIFLLFTYSWTSFICEHNVSYKGHVQINNVAFMTHYDMSLHIMMESSYILYALW